MPSDRRSTEKDDLIDRLKTGDPRAFRQLIETHQRSIYRVCLRMMRSEAEAEDMTQETFIRASRSMDQFRGEASLSTWLYRVAINLCKNRINYLQRRRSTQHRSLVQLEEAKGDAWQSDRVGGAAPETPDALAEGREAQALIGQALDQLPDQLKTILLLRDIEGLSYAEVSEVTQLPLGTVKSRLHQARLQLMELYRSLQGEGVSSDE